MGVNFCDTMLRMYMWQLVGHETPEGSPCSGIGEDLAPIMRLIEEHLAKATGFAGHIIEVVPRMSVFHLDAIHVPTGREWLGLRDSSGGIRWEEQDHPAGPDVACNRCRPPPSLAGGPPPQAGRRGAGR
jgi:hypothetical protein